MSKKYEHSYIILEGDNLLELSDGRKHLTKEETKNLIKSGVERGEKREAFKRVHFKIKA